VLTRNRQINSEVFAEPVVMKQLNKELADVPFIEDLTEKERQILKLLAGGFQIRK
jgi:DNA-binding NarL/FixJ family response regulator